jgi:hypothetical protein
MMNMVPRSVLKYTLVLLAILTCTRYGMAQPTWRLAIGAFDEDRCVAVRTSANGRIYAAGSTGSFGAGGGDIYLIELNGSGSLVWSRTIGTPALETATDMVLCQNGDLVIVGFSNSLGDPDYSGLVIRTDPNGEIIWQRSIGGAGWDFLHDVKETTTGDLLLCGQTYSNDAGQGRAWLILLDEDGNEIWERSYEGSREQRANSAVATMDGGYIIAGVTEADPEEDALLIKVDGSGELQWTRNYGGPGSEVAFDVVATSDGGYSIMGSTSSFAEFKEAYHFKVEGNGELLWERNWGQIGEQSAAEHWQLANDEFISIGYTTTSGGGGRDFFLLKSTPTGDFIFGRTFGGLEDEDGLSLALLSDGFVCAGSTRSFGSGNSDFFIVRTALDGTTLLETVTTTFDPLSTPELTRSYPALSLYPNPCNGRFQLGYEGICKDLRVVDASGRSVDGVQWSAGSREVQADLPEGSYVLELHTLDGQLLRARLHIVKP